MNPVKTLCFTLSLVALLAMSAAAQKTLYFYPPDVAKWISGRSYIYDLSNTPKPLTLDTNLCGWYKITLQNNDPLLDASQIWLGKTGVDKIGPKGKESDDPMYQGGNNYLQLGGFELRDIFGSRNTLYLVADAIDPDDPSAGWYDNANIVQQVEDQSRCTWNLAAFIYDTDISVHPDFSCGEYSMGSNGDNGKNTKPNCTITAPYSTVDAYKPGGNLKGACTGVRRGVVQSTLGADRKMKYNATGDKWSCWTNEDWFNKAFKPTEGVNVERCYDMPFKQRAGGSFEFNSDSLKNANGRLVGGFFPLELTTRGNADYSKCNNCDAKRPAESFAPLIKWITPDILENYVPKEGDFSDGDTPTRTGFPGALPGMTGTEGIWNWGNQAESPHNTETETRSGLSWYLHGNTAIKGSEMAPANLFFCFESHANFIYDPEQVFAFSGDDDIWVFINNKLVIDLGGGHLAAPGKVKLDTLGLTAGNEYPIDIFFCDRRSSMSNVRINTNMYVSSTVKFNAEPEDPEKRNYMCAEVAAGSDCKSQGKAGTTGINACGPQIATDLPGWTVEFYMVRRGSIEQTLLNLSNPECKGTEKDFTCYGGIRIEDARYSCGGEVRCQGNPTAAGRVTVTGNVNVFARLKDNNGVQQGRAIQIDQFKSEIRLNMVWGKLVGNNDPKNNTELKNAYGDLSSKEQWIIAGKRSPIYIASGDWSDGAFTTFAYDDEYSGLPSDAAGRDYKVNGASDGLKIYKSQTGSEEKNSGKLKDTGLDTLWIEGSYSIGEKDFTLDVTGSEPMKIHIYQPKLEFRNSGYAAEVPHDGFLSFTNGDPNPPYVGTPLGIYLAAVDPKRNGELCDHCTFNLTQSSTTDNSAINSLWGDGIVTSPDNKITNGKLATSMQGWDQVYPDRAEWSVFGPSKDLTNAKWTGLQFILPPVPMPRNSYIYDRNGDGIADSIRIEFNKAFKNNGAVIDSLLPALIEVVWSEKDTIRFHHPSFDLKNLKDFNWMKSNWTKTSNSTNANYWRDYVKGDSLIVIASKDTMFSKEVLTAGFKDGKGLVISNTPFIDADGVFTYQPAQSPVQDKVPPIVVKAVYEFKGSGDCMNSGSGCYQKLEVHLSEMVFPVDGASTEQIKDPFSFCLGFSQAQDNPGCPNNDITPAERHDQTWRNGWRWELPAVNAEDAAYSANYMPNTRTPANVMSSPKGDNIVNMAYYARNTASGGTTRMPKANDWIKIRQEGSAYKDAAENGINPREIGVIIDGVNPSKKKQIKITQVPGGNPDAPSLGGTFEDPNSLPPWINPGILGDIKKGGKDELFKCGDKETCKVAELLPVPPNLDGKLLEEAIRTYYPGSVGTVFQGISERIARDVDKVDSVCGGLCTTLSGKSLKENAAEGITIYASADYHTNIGNYVAHRPNFGLHCSAPIFQDNNGTGDCLNNPNATPPVGPHLYLAWNLRANSNRLVGAGAYVGISKFYWQLEYMHPTKGKQTKKLGEDEFIEMYGVKRKAK